jgi:hypothetical protein
MSKSATQVVAQAILDLSRSNPSLAAVGSDAIRVQIDKVLPALPDSHLLTVIAHFAQAGCLDYTPRPGTGKHARFYVTDVRDWCLEEFAREHGGLAD